MTCFQFHYGDKKEEPKTTKSSFSQSSFTDREVSQSGSDFNSQDASDTRTESRGRSQFPILSDRPSNLRAFTFSELKQATKNFNWSTKLGFERVFKGAVKISEDPDNKIDVAIKHLGRRGRQGHKEWVTELNVLSVVEHPNLVKLIGYCAEDERGIQVSIRLIDFGQLVNKY